MQRSAWPWCVGATAAVASAWRSARVAVARVAVARVAVARVAVARVAVARVAVTRVAVARVAVARVAVARHVWQQCMCGIQADSHHAQGHAALNITLTLSPFPFTPIPMCSTCGSSACVAYKLTATTPKDTPPSQLSLLAPANSSATSGGGAAPPCAQGTCPFPILPDAITWRKPAAATPTLWEAVGHFVLPPPSASTAAAASAARTASLSTPFAATAAMTAATAAAFGAASADAASAPPSSPSPPPPSPPPPTPPSPPPPSPPPPSPPPPSSPPLSPPPPSPPSPSPPLEPSVSPLLSPPLASPPDAPASPPPDPLVSPPPDSPSGNGTSLAAALASLRTGGENGGCVGGGASGGGGTGSGGSVAQSWPLIAMEYDEMSSSPGGAQGLAVGDFAGSTIAAFDRASAPLPAVTSPQFAINLTDPMPGGAHIRVDSLYVSRPLVLPLPPCSTLSFSLSLPALLSRSPSPSVLYSLVLPLPPCSTLSFSLSLPALLSRSPSPSLLYSLVPSGTRVPQSLTSMTALTSKSVKKKSTASFYRISYTIILVAPDNDPQSAALLHSHGQLLPHLLYNHPRGTG
ncbi:unnamed protein product [Closterium sp. NIES-64]|nr:unnamed protein product [Closterium sp. NIES-64]